jgi:hypothetical protein
MMIYIETEILVEVLVGDFNGSLGGGLARCTKAMLCARGLVDITYKLTDELRPTICIPYIGHIKDRKETPIVTSGELFCCVVLLAW